MILFLPPQPRDPKLKIRPHYDKKNPNKQTRYQNPSGNSDALNVPSSC